MIELETIRFPDIFEKYTKEISRFFPNPMQLMIISYIAAQPEPINEFNIIQKLTRIFPKHPERLIKHEINQLCLKRLIIFNNELKYDFNSDLINADMTQIFENLISEFQSINLNQEDTKKFFNIRNRVFAFIAKNNELISTFYEMKVKDLKKYQHNLYRRYGLEAFQQLFDIQLEGGKIDYLQIITQLLKDITAIPFENHPEIKPPISRNLYNANRKVKIYNETAKGTRIYFYSEKTEEVEQNIDPKNEDTTSVRTPKYAIKKNSIVFGVPKWRSYPSKLIEPISKEKSTMHHPERPPKNTSETPQGKAPSRPRGRPPKNISETPQEKAPSRPRGRPPKNPSVTPQDKTPPRPRGRPPKNKEQSIEKSNNLITDSSFSKDENGFE